MVATTSELSDSSPSTCLLRLLDRGGCITEASDQISIMLNGLRCYSLGVTLHQIEYCIQGYEQEAVDLFNTARTRICSEQLIKKIEDFV